VGRSNRRGRNDEHTARSAVGAWPLDPVSLMIAVSTLLAFGTLAMLVAILRVIRLDPRTVMR
jgi:hypothetical protein